MRLLEQIPPELQQTVFGYVMIMVTFAGEFFLVENAVPEILMPIKAL